MTCSPYLTQDASLLLDTTLPQETTLGVKKKEKTSKNKFITAVR